MSRVRTAGLLATICCVGLAACGGSDDDASAGTTAAPVVGSYPVTIEHTYGSTEITAAPQRIVTVGLTDHDPLLALGVVPVGVTDWFGEQPSATWPWAQPLLGGASPEIVGDTMGINYEQVAALDPDLIVGLYSGLLEEEYELLSAIAPTVAQPAEWNDWGIPWDEQTRTIGAIVGKPAEAEALIAGVEQQFADARAAHPEFEGATGLVATPYDGTLWVYAPQDVRGRFMESLGFEHVEEISAGAGEDFGTELSLEQLPLLDVDALVWIVDDVERDRGLLESESLYQQLGVFNEGRAVFVGTTDPVGSATSFVTVLSLPTLIDALVPELAAAVDGDPGT